MGRRGKSTPGTVRAWADAAVIVARREAGETLEVIAADYGIGKSTVKDIANAGGYVSPAKRARADVDRVRRLYAAGASSVALAAHYGCHNDTIVRMVATIPGRHNTLSVEAAEAGLRGEGLTLAEKRRIPTERFAEAYEACGGDRQATAAMLGVGVNAVSNRLGLSKPWTKSAVSTAEMVRRYAAGDTTTEIAAVAGISSSAVYDRLKAAGVEIRPRADRVSRARQATVLRRFEHAVCLLYAAGVPTRLLAKHFECGKETVRARAKAHGLTGRPNGSRPTPRELAVMDRMCAEVRAGHLVVDAGRLVPRLLEHERRAPAPMSSNGGN
jgi:hypothetical protein